MQNAANGITEGGKWTEVWRKYGFGWTSAHTHTHNEDILRHAVEPVMSRYGLGKENPVQLLSRHIYLVSMIVASECFLCRPSVGSAGQRTKA